MITQWKCRCGQQNSIVKRYCPQCSAEIPNDYISKISIEDLSWAKNILHNEKVIKWKNKSVARRKFFKKIFFPPLAILILLISITIFYSWRYFSGLLTAPMFQESFSKLFFGNGNRIISFFSNGFTVLRNKFGALPDGMSSLISILGLKGEKFHESAIAVTKLLNIRMNEIVESVSRINIIERVKGIVDGFIK